MCGGLTQRQHLANTSDSDEPQKRLRCIGSNAISVELWSLCIGSQLIYRHHCCSGINSGPLRIITKTEICQISLIALNEQ